MKSLIKYILTCAINDKILLSIFIGLLIATGVSFGIGNAAAYEQDEMTIIYAANMFRLLFVYGFAIFNVFFISKMFQTKEIETLIAGPISRATPVISIMIANLLMILLSSLLATIILKGYFHNIIPTYNILVWTLSITLEVMVVTSFAVFLSFLTPSPTISLLVTSCFYISARSLGFITSAFDNTPSGIISILVYVMSFVFPRLDLFSQSSWLIYIDHIPNVTIIITQSIIYITLLVLSCISDFQKKCL